MANNTLDHEAYEELFQCYLASAKNVQNKGYKWAKAKSGNLKVMSGNRVVDVINPVSRTVLSGEHNGFVVSFPKLKYTEEERNQLIGKINSALKLQVNKNCIESIIVTLVPDKKEYRFQVNVDCSLCLECPVLKFNAPYGSIGSLADDILEKAINGVKPTRKLKKKCTDFYKQELDAITKNVSFTKLPEESLRS